MICWYCHWGWPKPIADIYDKHVAVAGESAMHYGPAHIVWEDENFDRHNIQWCLDHFDEYKRDDCTEERHLAVRQSLLDMLALPDSILCCEPTDYDGENPDKFPPPQDLEMVRQ